MAIVPTVAIKGASGNRVLINESDYDPEVHELWEAEPPPETAGDYELVQSGSWWKILDADGEKVGKATQDEDKARERLEALQEGDA